MMPIRNSYYQNWLPTLFNDLADFDRSSYIKSSAVPAINVIEDDDEYKIEVAAPGMNKNDFKISLLDEDFITISLNKEEEEDNNRKYLRREFSFCKFEQTIALPDDVNRENISAEMKNGVLSIDLYKIKKEDRYKTPVNIEIK